jgi:hypothetical protein
MRQKFPLSLPPGPKNVDTMAFDALAAKCVEQLKPKRALGKDWISKGTWQLIAKWASLLQSGGIWQDDVGRMKREIGATIKVDKCKLIANISSLIDTGFAKGDVK